MIKLIFSSDLGSSFIILGMSLLNASVEQSYFSVQTQSLSRCSYPNLAPEHIFFFYWSRISWDQPTESRKWVKDVSRQRASQKKEWTAESRLPGQPSRQKRKMDLNGKPMKWERHQKPMTRWDIMVNMGWQEDRPSFESVLPHACPELTV